jgi:spore coat protein CotH
MTACSQEASETKDSNSADVSTTEVLADLDGYYSDTFGTGEITEINIEISEEDWDDLCINAMDETYYKSNITVNGTAVTDVGFRAKGASSLRSVADTDSNRYGFKIKFDKYVDDQTLNGLDMMVLNGSFSDPSYMREYLAYASSAYLGGTTPYISYTRLSINGEYFGLYLSIEAYDGSFVERITDGDEDAVLYGADTEQCTLLASDDGSGFDIAVGEDEGNTNILNLIDVLNSTTADNKEELESILDINSVLRAMAVNSVTGNYDSYNGSKAHNYYLLYSNGKFEYIAWDYNMAFGGFSEDGGKSVAVDVESPFYNVDSSMRPLMEKLLEIDEYKELYLSYVDELCYYLSDYEEKIADIADFIREDVETDPTAFYTIEQFESNIAASDSNLVESTQAGINDGQMPDNIPQSVADGEVPTLQDDEPPENPEGKTQTLKNVENQHPRNEIGGRENAISNQTVSIVDYIEQRLDIIKNL